MVWDRVLDYGWYAEAYHWTPEQVDRLPEWYARRLPIYRKILNDLEREDADRRRAADEARAALTRVALGGR